MAERARSAVPDRQSPNRPVPSTAPQGRSPRSPGPSPAGALALQRAVGNRAASRMLARWAAHPDKDKKGQFMTDEMAGEYNKFNPPLSK
jgi:hypothetical protein